LKEAGEGMQAQPVSKFPALYQEWRPTFCLTEAGEGMQAQLILTHPAFYRE
jgi:hypothetical protein